MQFSLIIDIPENVRKQLAAQLEPLMEEYPDLTWVHPDEYHISLFAFNDYTQEFIEKSVENVTYDTKEFYLYSGETGLFPRYGMELYVGFLKSQAIEALVKRIKKEMNIVDGLTFFPHLSVAKYKKPSKQQYLLLKKKWLKQKIDIEFGVTQITLYESVIEKSVPTYEPRTVFPLLPLKED